MKHVDVITKRHFTVCIRETADPVYYEVDYHTCPLDVMMRLDYDPCIDAYFDDEELNDWWLERDRYYLFGAELVYDSLNEKFIYKDRAFNSIEAILNQEHYELK